VSYDSSLPPGCTSEELEANSPTHLGEYEGTSEPTYRMLKTERFFLWLVLSLFVLSLASLLVPYARVAASFVGFDADGG